VEVFWLSFEFYSVLSCFLLLAFIGLYHSMLCIPCPLPSARQHPSYGDCLEINRVYYQKCSVLDCVTQCSQSAAHLYEHSYRSIRLGLSHWDPYTVCRGSCLLL